MTYKNMVEIKLTQNLWSDYTKLVERLHKTCGATTQNLWSDYTKLVERLHKTCGANCTKLVERTAQNLWSELHKTCGATEFLPKEFKKVYIKVNKSSRKARATPACL